MNFVRLTNKTSASIVIEDLGVSLQRSGGDDSSCLVSEREYLNSSDIKKYVGWIRVDFLVEKVPSPRVKPETTVVKSPDSPVKSPLPPPVSVPSQPSAEVAALHETIRSMDEKMAQMVALLSRAPVAQAPSYSYQSPTHTITSDPDPAPSDAPVFIPGTIVPKDATTHIKSKKSETNADDFDSAASSLKRMRRK